MSESYAHVGRQYGLGRQRILAIVQRACRQASPEAFGELAISSVPPYWTVPVAMLRRDAGRLIAAMGQAGGAAISVAKTAQRVAPSKTGGRMSDAGLSTPLAAPGPGVAAVAAVQPLPPDDGDVRSAVDDAPPSQLIVVGAGASIGDVVALAAGKERGIGRGRRTHGP